MRIQNEFEYFFCLRCNLRNDNINSAYQDLKNRAAHPHQEFPGVPPPPPLPRTKKYVNAPRYQSVHTCRICLQDFLPEAKKVLV